jgi:hypothetical protein
VSDDVVFEVAPNNDGKPNKIDVDRLLGRDEDTTATAAAGSTTTSGGYTFREVTSQNEISEAENTMTTPAEMPADEDSLTNDDVTFTAVDEPFVENDDSATDDDALVVKVTENKPRILDEDQLEEEPYNPLLDL